MSEELSRRVLAEIDRKIAKLERQGRNGDADRLERFKSNFLLYPFGPEGTTVSRKAWQEKEK